MPTGLRAGHRVAWRTAGTGDPAVLIHCGLAHSGAWAGVMEHLADRLSMTAFDLPGHGASDDWSGDGDHHGLSCEIAASFIDRPAHLVGHSYGGTICLRLAVERPELVRSLILFEPMMIAAAREAPEYEAFAESDRARKAAIAEGRVEWATRYFNRIWGTGARWEDLSGRQRAYMCERIGLIAEGDAATIDDAFGILPRLHAVRCPVTLIRGENSPAFVAVIHRGLRERMPAAREIVLPGAGHMAPIAHSGEVAGAIGAALSG